MKSFKDNKGRDWRIDICVPAADDVKAACDIDLLDVADEKSKTIERLLAEPRLLVNVIYVLCKEQADEAKITDRDFGRAMAGDAIDHATNALMTDIADFFRGSQRKTLAKIWEKTQEVEANAVTLALQKIDGLNIEALMAQASALSASNTLASSESSSVD